MMDQNSTGCNERKQTPIPYQREKSDKNDFIDREFVNRLRNLPNTLPDGLEWLDFRTEMSTTITAFYHTYFLHGTGDPPKQLQDFITRRMGSNPPNLILMIADTQSQFECDVTTDDGKEARLIGIMICESYDIINQGKRASVISIGGLAIATEWRRMGLATSLMKRGARRVSSGEYMYLFNLKKDRKLFPCAEISVWWYPLKSCTSLNMTIFKLDPSPSPETVSELSCRVADPEYSNLPCRPMTYEDVAIVCEMLKNNALKFPLARCWTSEHVVRWFLPEDDVQFSYIVTDQSGQELLDFFAFHIISYCVPRRGYETTDNRNEFLALPSSEEETKKEEETTTLRIAVPSYLTSRHTNKEVMMKYVMRAALHANCDFIHGYGAMGCDNVFQNLSFVKNENEIHFLQMLNWETRSFKGDEIGLSWIQF